MIPMAVFVEGLRKIAGSVYAVGRDCSINQSTLREWRRGVKDPKLPTIAKIWGRYPDAREELLSLLEATLDLYAKEEQDGTS